MKNPGPYPAPCGIQIHITCTAEETQVKQLTWKMDLEILKPPEFPTETNAKPLFRPIITPSGSQDSRGKKQPTKGKFTLKGYECIK